MLTPKRRLLAALAGGVLLLAATLTLVLARDRGDASASVATRASVTASASVSTREAVTETAAPVCSPSKVDIFSGIRSPYRVTELDAEDAKEILASMNARPEARKAYRLRAVTRSGDLVAIVIAVAVGTNADARAGFLDGAQRAARRAGTPLTPEALAGHRVLVGRPAGEAVLYGVLDCGAVVVNAVDVRTARALHRMIVAA